MATEAFEELVEDFEFLDDWEDRYRHVIDLGKAMEPLTEELRVPATKVDGCASQVWLHTQFEDGVLHFDGASDAMIDHCERESPLRPSSSVALLTSNRAFGRMSSSFTGRGVAGAPPPCLSLIHISEPTRPY